MLRLDRTHTRFLGIELGVVETKLAPLPVGAQREDQWTTQVETPKSAEEWLASLQAPISRLRQDGLLGVLVSVPGIVDEPGGRVLFSPNLHWTEGVELPSMIRQVLDVPVVLVQEERALALGHQMFDPNNEDFLLVDFGDGVGGAIIVGGRLYANAVPISGELGHTPVIGNMRSCGCGAQGCVETLVSTRGLLQSYAAAHPDGRHSWADLVEHVNQAGVPGWLATALEATAVVIAGALNVLGLRRVIITGSLTELPPAVCQHLANAIGKGAMWARFGKVECQSAPRRRTAGLVAVGIDRLVMPMVGTVKATEEVLAG
jgi:predicted NBD/HSP70 family sugar kinase